MRQPRRLHSLLEIRNGLSIVVASYLFLGALYVLSTPSFEAADEFRHYLYVEQIADGRGLPVQSPAGDNPALQEASQPPLYYLIAAAATLWVDKGQIEQTIPLNPHAALGRPGSPDNKNVVVHGAEEEFPWHGPILAVRIIRLLSLLLGAATVIVSYGVARELQPDRPGLAVSVAGFAAFIPSFLFISAAINNDNLVIFIASLVLLIVLRYLRGAPVRGGPLLIGALCGLAAISKVSGLAVLPLAVLVVGFSGLTARRSWLLTMRDCLLVVAGALAVAGWWYLRNWMLYGEPLGLAAMVDVAGSRPAGFGLLDLLSEHEGLRWSFWAVFGGFNIIADRWLYWLYDLIMAGAAVGLTIAAVKVFRDRLRGSDFDSCREGLLAPWFFAGIWLVIFLAALARWSISTMGTQGRLLYPALPVIATFACYGLARVVPVSVRRPAAITGLIGLALLAAYLPFAYISPAYSARPLVPTASAAPAPNPILAMFADRIMLEGYEVDRRTAQAGGTITLALYWRFLQPADKNYSIFVHAYSADGKTVGQIDSYPGGGTYATSRLPSGLSLTDVYQLKLSDQSPAGTGSIVVGLYDFETMETLPARDASGKRLAGAINLGDLRIIPRDMDSIVDANRIGVNLGGQIVLEGYRSASERARPGETIEGTVFWRALARPAENYTVFVHLEGPRGLVAQQDSPPLSGDYPTRDWRQGDLIADPFVLLVPAIPPGEYSLVAGLYGPPNARRLQVEQSVLNRLTSRMFGNRKGSIGADSVILSRVKVD